LINRHIIHSSLTRHTAVTNCIDELLQIGVGDEVSIDELMDVASEPHEYNIYRVSNYSELTLDVGNRLINVLCNSKHLCPIYKVCQKSEATTFEGPYFLLTISK